MNAGQYILTGADTYNLLKNVFYYYFTAGEYFMCFMQNVYGNIFFMHFLPLSPPGWRGIVVKVRAGGRAGGWAAGRAAAKLAEPISL